MKTYTKLWKGISDPIRFNTAHLYYHLRKKGRRKEARHDTPMYSIIVASYNYARLIRETLDSLLGQTYQRFEVIVVDDGSKDNSVEVIKEYCARDSRVKLYTHPGGENRGLCETVRLALSKAQGEYIAFCESDDMWDAEHLSTITAFMNQYDDVVLVHNKIRFIGSPESNLELVRYIEGVQRCRLHTGYNRINIHHHPTHNMIATFSSVVIRTDVLRSLDFNSPVPSHLDLWLYRQILKDHPLHYCPAAITLWRIHPNSFCTKDKVGRMEETLQHLVAESDKLIER